MTSYEKEQIAKLQQLGYGYRRIAAELTLPIDTVKSFIKRHPIAPNTTRCEFCGGRVVQMPKHKHRRFCCDHCRRSWWKKHPEAAKPQRKYPGLCENCGQAFLGRLSTSRFCCRKCYLDFSRKEMP